MPVGGVVNSQSTSYLSNKDLDRVFIETLEMYPAEYTQFTKMSETKDRYIREGEISALGPLVYKPEGSMISLESIKQGNTKTVTFKNYALACAITEEAKDWDKQGIIKRIPEFLALSSQYTKEITAVDLLLSGFVSTYRVGVDGQPLFSTSHTILDPWTGAASATFSNLQTGASLSASTIAAARDYFENLVNSKGLPVRAGRRILLVVGPALRDTAKILLENEVDPTQNYSTKINVNQNSMSFMVSHYLGSTYEGYFFIDLDLMDLRHIVSKPFQRRMWDDPWTGNTIYGISGRWTFDFFSAYGVCANAGS